MYILNVLIPFNLLIDTDMGLIKLIEYEYHNDEYFWPGMIDCDDTLKQFSLLSRTDPNPLSVVMKSEDPELQQDLYSQFMEKEYSSILKLSSNTSLCGISSILRTSIDKSVRVTALCKTQEEADLIKKRHIPVENIILGEPETISLDKYNVLFLKDVEDIRKYKNVDGKEIYIANYGFNMVIEPDEEQPLLPMEVLYDYASSNEFSLISVYTFRPEDIPVG